VAPAAAAAIAQTVAPVISPPVAASAATRTPFTRPSQANPNFVPRSLDTGFIPEFETFPMIMLPQMPRVPRGISNPVAAQPQSGGVPTAGDVPAAVSAAAPAAAPAQVTMKSGRALPFAMIQAMGIMPGVRGVRTGKVNPGALVASGRNPGTL
jgi:hypothetical protein